MKIEIDRRVIAHNDPAIKYLHINSTNCSLLLAFIDDGHLQLKCGRTKLGKGYELRGHVPSSLGRPLRA